MCPFLWLSQQGRGLPGARAHTAWPLSSLSSLLLLRGHCCSMQQRQTHRWNTLRCSIPPPENSLGGGCKFLVPIPSFSPFLQPGQHEVASKTWCCPEDQSSLGLDLEALLKGHQRKQRDGAPAESCWVRHHLGSNTRFSAREQLPFFLAPRWLGGGRKELGLPFCSSPQSAFAS